MGICSGTSTEWLFVHCSRSNWNLAVLIFAEGGKPENPEKNPRSEDENQQQTQPTYGTGPESNPGHIGTLTIKSEMEITEIGTLYEVACKVQLYVRVVHPGQRPKVGDRQSG